MIELPDFDDDFASAADYARMYRALGLQVVPAKHPNEDPINYKRPIISWKEFEDDLTPEATFDRWYGPQGEHRQRSNMGLVTGKASGGVFCVDLDVKDGSQAMAWWAGLIGLHGNNQEPDTPSQKTGGGGRQILFRAPEGYSPPTFKTSIGIDIRGQGGFMMCPPSRHLSGRDYAWEAGKAPYEVEVEEAPDWLMEAIDALRLEFGGTPTGPRERADSTSLKNDLGLDIDDREQKMQRAVWGKVVDLFRDSPIKPSQGEQDAALAELWTWYLSSTASRLAPRSGMDKADLLEAEGRGWSEMARKWRYAMNKWDKEVKAAAAIMPEKPAAEPVKEIEPVRMATETASYRFEPRSFTGEIPPPRPWAYGNFLMYGAVTGIAAPPGVGKTTFSVQLGIAFSLDMKLGPWDKVPGGGGKVWLYNGEEPQEELDRRFMAASCELGVEDHVAANRFFYNSGLDEPLQFVRVDPQTKEIQRHPDTDKIIEIIKAQGVRLFIVDPLIEFNGATEDGEGLKAAGSVLREIANACQCAVLFFHHTPKASTSDTAAGDMNAMRGGGPLIGSARFVSTMFAMSLKDADDYDVPKNERHKYVRFDDAKANMTVMSGEPQWWIKLGVCINNEDSIRPADSIGILRPVQLRSDGGEDTMAQQMARATQKEIALDRVAAEMIRVCLKNGNTTLERAESFDTLMRALDPIRTGVSVNTAKDMIVGGMGESRVSGENRVVISSVQRGKLTARRVFVEAVSE
jgi:hypothetical protein